MSGQGRMLVLCQDGHGHKYAGIESGQTRMLVLYKDMHGY